MASPGVARPADSLRARARRWFLRIPKRKVLLVAGDLLVVNICLFITQALRAKLGPSWESIWRHSYWFATLSIMWLVVGWSLGSFKLPQAYGVPYSLKTALTTVGIVSLLYFLIPILTPTLPSRRSDAMRFVLLMLGGTGLWRFLFARSLEHFVVNRRALIIGAGWAGSTLAETLSSCPSGKRSPYSATQYELVGFIDDDVMKQGQVIAGLPVLGTHENLLTLIRELRPDELVLAVTRRSDLHPEMFQAILDCRELGVTIVRMQAVYESLTRQVPIEHSGNNLDVIIPLFPSTGQRLYSIFREAADGLAAIPALVLLGLMIPIVWAANRLASPGPLFYWQERVGKSGKVFRMLKFRSMVVDAERQTGEVWAKENDARITPIGRFLRKSRLDEMPQFWNVLKGEMSLIGPRPERQHFVEHLTREIPFYRLRHAVKPGITGWAQVCHHYSASVNDTFIKVGYDFYYIKNQSVFLDLAILLKTVRLVLGGKGR
jgi:exopolysaccharide biosynthesis polyprenyl glycosylphosphotransferase